MNDRELTVGVVVVTAVMGFCVLVFSGAIGRLLAPKGHTVAARFTDTGRLRGGEPVRVRGIAVGKVASLQSDPGARTTTVRMDVLDDAGPLYADARADLRWRTVLGGSYVINLDPGTAGAGPLHGTIPVSRTSNQVELDQVASAFGEAPRAGLKTMLHEFPQALADHAAPATALRTTAAAAPNLRTALTALRGTQEGDLGGLISHTHAVVAALDTPTNAARALIGDAALTLDTTAARARDLSRTIRRADQVMPNVRTTVDQLDHTLAIADPVLARLAQVAPDVAPTLARLRPTLINADGLLGRAVPLLHALRPGVQSLAAAAREGRPLLIALTPSLNRTAHEILPDFAKVDPDFHGPAYQFVGGAIQSLGGGAAGFDKFSHLFRFPASGSERAVNGTGCQTALTDPTAPELANCQALLDVLGAFFGGSTK